MSRDKGGKEMVICNDKLTVVRIKAELTHAYPLRRRVPEASA